jgi:uncharacterized protein with HEPN domain
MYSDNIQIVKNLLKEVDNAISMLKEWNTGIESSEYYLNSPDGMRTLAASCMLLEAIGESIKKIDKVTKGDLLIRYPEIPWRAIMGIRDHIAHGYFDIDSDVIWDTIQNDLTPLSVTVKQLMNQLYER